MNISLYHPVEVILIVGVKLSILVTTEEAVRVGVLHIMDVTLPVLLHTKLKFGAVVHCTTCNLT